MGPRTHARPNSDKLSNCICSCIMTDRTGDVEGPVLVEQRDRVLLVTIQQSPGEECHQ